MLRIALNDSYTLPTGKAIVKEAITNEGFLRVLSGKSEMGEPKFSGILSLEDVGLFFLDDSELSDSFWLLLELSSGICNSVRLESFLRDFVFFRSSLAYLSETSADG